ncbi:MAG: hypothetical protein DHS20C11_35480 [Lysobacteraceae bacterium]|nr:MAG: hypothetical protein DHS20C11_35480 [Xanthomonadaceae bacterium]
MGHGAVRFRAGILFSILLVFSVVAGANDDDDQVKAMIDRAQALVDAAELRGGTRIAANEMEAARDWIEKADESRKRRSYGRARIQADKAMVEAELADLISKTEMARAQRTQLEGAVTKLRQQWEGDQ